MVTVTKPQQSKHTQMVIDVENSLSSYSDTTSIEGRMLFIFADDFTINDSCEVLFDAPAINSRTDKPNCNLKETNIIR